MSNVSIIKPHSPSVGMLSMTAQFPMVTPNVVLQSEFEASVMTKVREEEENNLPQMKKLFFLYVWLNLTRIPKAFGT